METKKYGFRSRKGQGIVEFALAFPVFLLIVLGIFEFGRLFITYTSVYAAAREGARWGAAVDNLCDGTVTSQAKRAGFIAGDLDVTIKYDHGVQDPIVEFSDCGTAKLGDRIIVTVSVPFEFVTGLIPTPGGSITLESVAKRTIIQDVYLTWTLPPP